MAWGKRSEGVLVAMGDTFYFNSKPDFQKYQQSMNQPD